MIEIEFSIVGHTPERIQELNALLAGFTAAKGIRVHVTSLAWSSAWHEIVQTAIHGHGADVSEAGTTWMADLVKMNALRPLSPKESWIGKESDYIPAAWRNCYLPDDALMWGVPWLSGVRVIYYRRDLLAQAGIAEEQAFTNAQAFENTLERLVQAGMQRPWAVVTKNSLNTLHQLASWVWGAGGRFFSVVNNTVSFASNESLDGMAAYFRLGRYLGADADQLDENYAQAVFRQGEAAATIDGSWLFQAIMDNSIEQVRENLGVAVVPGVPFVGGSNLVVWKHSRQPEAAWELVRFLNSPEVLAFQNKSIGLLPARFDLLHGLASQNPLMNPIFERSLANGRSWPTLPFAGMVENRLREAFGFIWQDVLENPGRDPGEIAAEYLAPLQRRLQITLQQR